MIFGVLVVGWWLVWCGAAVGDGVLSHGVVHSGCSNVSVKPCADEVGASVESLNFFVMMNRRTDKRGVKSSYGEEKPVQMRAWGS